MTARKNVRVFIRFTLNHVARKCHKADWIKRCMMMKIDGSRNVQRSLGGIVSMTIWRVLVFLKSMHG